MLLHLTCHQSLRQFLFQENLSSLGRKLEPQMVGISERLLVRLSHEKAVMVPEYIILWLK